MKKILIFVDWFKPGYKAGGPIRSVSNLIDHFKEEFEFHVVTSDRDLGDSAPYPDIPVNQWINREQYRIIYLNKNHQSISRYKEILEEGDYDRFYINSMFSLPFTVKPLLALRKRFEDVILAPRGMLGKGSLRIKPIKKKIYLILFRLLGIGHKVKWHATSSTEKSDIQEKIGRKTKIKTVRNLSSVILSSHTIKEKSENILNLYFLSRISKIKNLAAALEYLSQVDQKNTIRLDIFGPIEDESYWKSCREMIRKLPDNITVEYKGSVPNEELNDHLADQHVMILPTLHENYGHVIVESWQNSCPVIISDNTPWSDLESRKIGFDIPLTEPETFVNAINQMAEMNEDEFNDWSFSSFEYAKKITYDDEILNTYRELFYE